MVREAQKRANAKYKKRNVKTVCVAFYPKDKQAYEFVKTHGGAACLRQQVYEAMAGEEDA